MCAMPPLSWVMWNSSIVSSVNMTLTSRRIVACSALTLSINHDDRAILLDQIPARRRLPDWYGVVLQAGGVGSDEGSGSVVKRSRVLFAGFLAAAVAVSTFGIGIGEAAPAASPRVDRRATANWSPCFREQQAELAEFFPPELGLPTYECTTVQVPLDYDDRRGGAISVSMVRLPALDPDRRIGSLFLNPGGPGGSGVDFAVFGAPFLYSRELRSRFDLVGFDPRGVARSTALKCFGNLNQAVSIFQAPVIAFPKDAAEAEAWFGNDQRLADACDQRGNKVLDHMSTANVARDLDLLRQAVGDEQLTYAGYSYGSYLGVTYANLFPGKVRALIVDGVLNPIDWSTGDPGEEGLPFSSRLRSNIGAQATLEEFFRLCDAAGPPACAFAPDSAVRYEAIAEFLLDNEPVSITVPDGPNGEPVEIPFFYGDLIGMSLGALYDSFSWPFMAEDLAFLESVIAGGPAAAPATFAVGQTFQAYTAKRGFPRYFNFVESFPAVACADSDNPDRIADWVAVGRRHLVRRLLPSALDLRQLAVPGLPHHGRGPLQRTVRRRHGEPGARGKHAVRPGHPGPRCPRGGCDPAELGALARRRLGAHHARDLRVRLVLQRALPHHRRTATTPE